MSDHAPHTGVLELMEKVDMKSLMEGALHAFTAAAIWTEYKGPLPEGEGLLLDVMTPAGRLIVTGRGPDVQITPASILIDIGGDDRYEGAVAGGSCFATQALTLCVDLGGDDLYAGKDGSQGSTRGGYGILVDRSGNDVYKAEDWSQASALLGAALLWDGSGNDVYAAGRGGQSFAMGGIAILSDQGGNDNYTLDALGQACGGTLGVAILDEARGHDSYRGGGRHGFYQEDDAGAVQGAAMGLRHWTNLTACGGVGLLCDQFGDDRYRAASIGQGGSYILGLGALVDSSGNDDYTGENYCMGSGCHVSSGVLIDRQGDDQYTGLVHNNIGAALDRSTAVFLDGAGNDIYRADIGMGFAGKNRGFGVFIDASGCDTYISEFGNVCGWVYGPVREDAASRSFFFDWGGRDSYPRPDQGNHAAWRGNGTGRGQDAEQVWTAKDLSPGTSLFSWPTDSCAFDRLAGGDPANMDFLSRRHLRGGLDDADVRNLTRQLESPSPEERKTAVWALHLSGVKTVNGALDTLALNDKDPGVRLLALLRRADAEVPDAVLRSALRDDAWRVRHAAAFAAGKLRRDGMADLLIERFTQEPEGRVRAALVNSLGASKEDRVAAFLLQSAARDPNPFVRVYAANHLYQSHQAVVGLDLLMDLLAVFGDDPLHRPVHDRLYLPMLELWTGKSFQKAGEWKQWWAGQRGSFNLERAARMASEIQGFVKNPGTTGREEGWRALLAKYPGHIEVLRQLADTLDAKASQALEGDPGRALHLATEAVALAANGHRHLTLARALRKAGRLEEALLHMKTAIDEYDMYLWPAEPLREQRLMQLGEWRDRSPGE